MAEIFNEYYTKNYELPGRFTAINGAIQYFKLTANGVEFEVAPLAEDATDEEKKEHALKEQAARANYLRVLEVLRSRGPQPIITSVEGSDLHFTVEQTWAWGLRKDMQVSAKNLKDEAEADIKNSFADIKSFKVNDAKTAVVEGDVFDIDVEVKVTAGSLDSND